MSALLSSWAEEKEYKTGHNEKIELKSILTNTIRGYILCIVRYRMGVYERGTVFNRVRQVPCRGLCGTVSKSPAWLRISALT